MPNNILITPGSASIEFSGSAANNLKLQVLSNGNVAITGSIGKVAEFSNTGQVFITSSMQARQFTGSFGIIAFVGTASRVDDGAYLSIPQTFSALKTFSAGIDLANADITGVNNITINDPGPGEGISWAGGNLWKIYESPNDLSTNSGGNLQIVENATRRATFNTSGQLEIPVATGTAPFVVSSTTTVTNLSADLLDGYNQDTANTANTIVRRDGSGNFSAGTITAYLSGYADHVDSNDTRATNDTPASRNSGVYFDFKQNSTNGLSDGGTYNGQMTWRSYGSGTDLSGGQPIQIAYTANSRIWTRIGTGTTTWASWRQLLDSVSQIYAYNMDQNVRTTDTVTFAGVYLPDNGNVGINDSGFDVYINFSDSNPTYYGDAYGGVFTFYGDKSVPSSFLDFGGAQVRRTLQAGSSLRAPIFYDSDSTAYYADLHSTGTSINIQGSLRAATYNKPAILSVASGTSSTGGSLAIQQETGEGWTGVFVDYEPYTGWGLWHDNPNNYFSFTAEASTGQIRSFTVPSRVSGNRTAYEKFRIDQNNGDVIIGRAGYAQTSLNAPIYYDYTDTAFFINPDGYSRISRLALNNARVSTGQRFPVGHYTPGETVFEMDPTWTDDQLQAYFNSGNVSWVADSSAPGGYAIQIAGSVYVGGVYGSGFPYIPVDQDDLFYMEVWIRNTAGSNGHYMGSIDFNQSFGSLGGNPGSFGYWVMSNSNPGSSWTKYSGYIGGFGSSVGQFVSGTKYWTPQALFNYTGGGTCYISGWKVIKVSVPGNRTFRNNITVSGTTTLNSTITMNAGLIAGGVNNGSVIFYRASNPWSLGGTDSVLTVSDRSSADWGIRIDKQGADYALLIETSTAGAYGIYLNDGRFRVYGDGRIDAPIMYDYNSTSYYIDPASTSYLNRIRMFGDMGMNAGTAIYFGYEEGFGGGDTGGADYGYITYDNNNSTYGTGAGETSTLRIGTQNDGDGSVGDHIAVEAAANIYLRPGAWGGSGAVRVGTRTNYATEMLINEMRSPIYRDANDTGYYYDPNSTSQSAGRQRGGTLYGPNPTWGAYLYVGTDGRQGLVDSGTPSVASTNGNLHMDAGSGYQMYLNYYDGTAIYFGGGAYNNWGEFSGGIFYAYNQMRSPIMYDYNNAGYYIDPDGGSRLNVLYPNEIYNYGWFRNQNSGQGMYNQSTGMHWYSNNGYWKSAGGGYGYGGIVMYNNYESDLRGFAGYWDGSGFGMLNSSGNWQIRIEYGNANMELYRVTWANDMRAYIYYDRDNTGYYLNPFGYSTFASTGLTLEVTKLGGGPNSRAVQFANNTGDNSWGIVTEFRVNGGPGGDRPSILFSSGFSSRTWSVGFGYADDNFRINENHGHRNGGWGNTRLLIDQGSTTYIYGTLQVDFIYDRNNTGYYVNPESVTQLNYVLANNWFRPQGCTGVYWESYGRGIWSPECEGNPYGHIATYGGGRNGWYGYGVGSRYTLMSTMGDNFGLHDSARGWIWYMSGAVLYLYWASNERMSMQSYGVYVNNGVWSPIYYDHDTSYYFDGNGTTSWNWVTDRSKDRVGNTFKYNNPRSNITSDSNYWVGTMGWGTTDFMSLWNWGSGFIDTWGNPGNQPAGTSHWVGVQAAHYTCGYNCGYGIQMVGGPISGLWFTSYWSSKRPWYKVAMYDLNEYSNTFWATVMYDSNDGGYRVDPNGDSQLRDVYTAGWLRPQGCTGVYWQSYGRGIWSPECEGNPYGHIATYGGGRNGWYGYGVGSRYTLMSTLGDNFGLHDSARGWIWYMGGAILYLYYASSERMSMQPYGVYVNNGLWTPVIYDANDSYWLWDGSGGSEAGRSIRVYGTISNTNYANDAYSPPGSQQTGRSDRNDYTSYYSLWYAMKFSHSRDPGPWQWSHHIGGCCMFSMMHYSYNTLTLGGESIGWGRTGRVRVTAQQGFEVYMYDNGGEVGDAIRARQQTGTYYSTLFRGYFESWNSGWEKYIMLTTNQGTITHVVYGNGSTYNQTGAYGVWSDISLKQDVMNASSQWDDIKQLRIVKFKFKDDVRLYGESAPFQIGLIAQEVEQTSPGLITESDIMEDYEEDEYNAQGVPTGRKLKKSRKTGNKLKAIKQSILYMKAMKALQEAMDRIEVLEEEIRTLKAG